MTERNVIPPHELTEQLERNLLGDTPLTFGDTGSSLVASAAYEPDQRVLDVALKAGALVKVYRYAGVSPSLWVQFYQAESKGSFFNRYIKTLFQGVQA